MSEMIALSPVSALAASSVHAFGIPAAPGDEEINLENTCFDLVNDAEFIGEDRAMDQISELLGLYDGRDLPQDAGPLARTLRKLAIDVMGRQLPADAAIDFVRRLIDGSAIAEEDDLEAA